MFEREGTGKIFQLDINITVVCLKGSSFSRVYREDTSKKGMSEYDHKQFYFDLKDNNYKLLFGEQKKTCQILEDIWPPKFALNFHTVLAASFLPLGFYTPG